MAEERDRQLMNEREKERERELFSGKKSVDNNKTIKKCLFRFLQSNSAPKHIQIHLASTLVILLRIDKHRTKTQTASERKTPSDT